MPDLGPPEALSPRDWHALVDYDEWDDLYTPDEGVVFHHGGSFDYPAGRTFSIFDEIQQLQSWEGYHIYSQGWRGLAYGWGVGQTGTIYRIRGWNSYGAHRGDHDGDGISNNEELIPIIWIASGNHHSVSQEAQDAVYRLRRWMLSSAPQATRLYGHREVSTTTCPGANGMAYVTTHRELPEEDDMRPPDWARDATQWHIDRGIYSENRVDDVDEDVEFHRQSVFRHRFYNAIRGEFGAGRHDHDGRYVRDITVTR